MAQEKLTNEEILTYLEVCDGLILMPRIFSYIIQIGLHNTGWIPKLVEAYCYNVNGLL